MSTRAKVWQYRIRALAWFPITAYFLLTNPDAVWVVFLYSAYANFASDWSSGEAADDRELKAQIKSLEEEVVRLRGNRDA